MRRWPGMGWALLFRVRINNRYRWFEKAGCQATPGFFMPGEIFKGSCQTCVRRMPGTNRRTYPVASPLVGKPTRFLLTSHIPAMHYGHHTGGYRFANRIRPYV